MEAFLVLAGGILVGILVGDGGKHAVLEGRQQLWQPRCPLTIETRGVGWEAGVGEASSEIRKEDGIHPRFFFIYR